MAEYGFPASATLVTGEEATVSGANSPAVAVDSPGTLLREGGGIASPSGPSATGAVLVDVAFFSHIISRSVRWPGGAAVGGAGPTVSNASKDTMSFTTGGVVSL